MAQDARARSREWFRGERELWWNADFLRLMATRWRLVRARRVLDVGCGQGHWGRALMPHLPASARLVGVDPEHSWLREARRRASRAGHGARVAYAAARVELLPFRDAAFDVVTCQTLLIHLPDPGPALREMIRVLRPGGLVAVAEPNNLAGSLVMSSLDLDAPVASIVARVEMELVRERGKVALGLGNSSLGDHLPALFAAAGLEDVGAWQSDRCAMLLPPYRGNAQRAIAADALASAAAATSRAAKTAARAEFLAGGGTREAFAAAWAGVRDHELAVARSVRTGRYAGAGGGVFYLVSGRKPRARRR